MSRLSDPKTGSGIFRRSIVNRVGHFARLHELWRLGDRVLLAVSGGADSLCMLSVMASLAPRHGISLTVAYLHHGMRGEVADAEERWVGGQAASLDLPFTAGHADVPGLAREEKLGIEEAGRLARRRFLDRVAEEVGAHHVATAHTRSDHVESVLLHLFRGSGLQGLIGIPPNGYGNRVRPMLCLDRMETEAYCAAVGLVPRQDPANEDMAYQRNRIRRIVLPLLREQINPAVDDAIARASQTAFVAMDLVRQEGVSLRDRSSTPEAGLYRRDLILKAPEAAGAEAIRLALCDLNGTGNNISFADVSRILGILRTGGAAPLSCGGVAEASGSYLRLSRQTSSPPRETGTPPRETSGSGISEPRGVCPSGSVSRSALAPQPGVRVEPADASRGPEAANDAQSVVVWVVPPVEVRKPLAGDKIRPLRRNGSKKLTTVFKEARIPTWERSKWPVVADALGVVWVVGLAVAERTQGEPGNNDLAERMLVRLSRE